MSTYCITPTTVRPLIFTSENGSLTARSITSRGRPRRRMSPWRSTSLVLVLKIVRLLVVARAGLVRGSLTVGLDCPPALRACHANRVFLAVGPGIAVAEYWDPLPAALAPLGLRALDAANFVRRI